MTQSIDSYFNRAPRYNAACAVMVNNGLVNHDVIVDMGAGQQDLDFCLRYEWAWRGKYIPLDKEFGFDLEDDRIKFEADWFVGLEILEHLYRPAWLIENIKPLARKGIIVSTPNPDICNVLEMDSDHTMAISAGDLEAMGFAVYPTTLYEGRYSNGNLNDGLIGVWIP